MDLRKAKRAMRLSALALAMATVAAEGAELERPPDYTPAPSSELASRPLGRIAFDARRVANMAKAQMRRFQLTPIRMPAARTSAPPTITFAAADSGGTSM